MVHYDLRHTIFLHIDRMLAVRVKGKSTRAIRPVYVLVDKNIEKAIDSLIANRVNNASDFIFTR